VDAHIHGQAELGADPVRAGNQDRLAITGGYLAQCAESSEPAEYLGPGGAAGDPLDPFNQGVACIDIDAGILVTQRGIPAVVRPGVSAGLGGRSPRAAILATNLPQIILPGTISPFPVAPTLLLQCAL